MRQTEAAALSFASELRETEEKGRDGGEREIWWADSSMFKEGVLSGASGRMSGVPLVHIREISHRGDEPYACADVPSQNTSGNGGEGGQEVTSHGVMEEENVAFSVANDGRVQKLEAGGAYFQLCGTLVPSGSTTLKTIE